MVSIYPDDAIFDVDLFSVLGSVLYTNTGVETVFNLNSPANFEGEVLAIADGITQASTTFTLANVGATVNFFSPPNVSNLTLKTISVPKFFSKTISIDGILDVIYSNNSVTNINGNNYIIDGVQTAWAVPENTNPESKEDLLIAISGILQSQQTYTFPSATLDNQGIDISPALEGTDNLLLDIRSIITSTSIIDRVTSMVDRKPDRGFGVRKTFDISEFKSQAGYEKRKLRSRRPTRIYNITYTNITGLEKEAIEDYYDARSGKFEAFRLDLSHLNDVGFITVRFGTDLDITNVFQKSDDLKEQIFTISLTLNEVYD